MASINRLANVYPQDAILENAGACDVINIDQVHSIPCLLEQRITRNSDSLAYAQFSEASGKWQYYNWGEIKERVRQWRLAIRAENCEPGDRAAIRLHNSVEWVLADQAVLAEGMVTVPVFSEDRADNIAYILDHAGVRILFLESYLQWSALLTRQEKLQTLQRVIILDDHQDGIEKSEDSRVVGISQWLEGSKNQILLEDSEKRFSGEELATIVYTSGTTGRPKGVMLSHRNMLTNAYAGLQSIAIFPSDRFVSFLPLSHMFERTVGYYLPLMSGAQVFFSRSIDSLMEDIQFARPTALVTVPRIFEKVLGAINARLESSSRVEKLLFRLTVSVGWQKFLFEQGRARFSIKQLAFWLLDRIVAAKIRQKFGGKLRLAVCGGARLDPEISRTLIGLGIPVLQGYGLTETSPVLTVNILSNNRPETIGLPFRGAELRLGDNDELQVRSPFNMLGYWEDETASSEIQDSGGWLHTGDQANIDSDGFISITGRLKEIIVLANGEKVPPADMETAIISDPMFEQALVLGEGRAYLTAVVVINQETWHNEPDRKLNNLQDAKSGFTGEDLKLILERITVTLAEFPGYAFIRNVHPVLTPWTVDNGLMTPTLKLKRSKLLRHFQEEIEEMYLGKSPIQN